MFGEVQIAVTKGRQNDIPNSQKAIATFQSTLSEKARRRWRNIGHENEGEPGIGSMSFSALEEDAERRLK